MNTIDTQQILSQIRSLSAELQSTPQATPPVQETGEFGGLLKNAINAVNEAQQSSASLKRDYVAEVPGTELTDVMIASQKADLSFRAMTEVRNKLVTAYQDIMNMPV